MPEYAKGRATRLKILWLVVQVHFRVLYVYKNRVIVLT